MTTAVRQCEAERRDKLIWIGDGQLNIPYSLAFDSRFNALDIRVWLASRACGERRKPFDLDFIGSAVNASRDAIIDSVSALDMLGWLVVRFKDGLPGTPIVCAQHLDLFAILRNNPGFRQNLAYYAQHGSPRIKQLSATVRAELTELTGAD